MQTKENTPLQSDRKKTDVNFTSNNNSDNIICPWMISAPDIINSPLLCSSQRLYLGKINLNLGSLAKAMKIPFTDHVNRSQNFVNKRIAKVHKYRVYLFRKLGSIGNKKNCI